jgi:uncharacterized protein YkwD
VIEPHLLPLLNRSNNARAANSARALRLDSRLSAAALDHARFLAASGYISHGGQGDSTPAMRAENAGYAWSRVGENVLARTSGDADAAWQQWWDSAGHRANLLEPAFVDCGLGRAYSPRVDCWYYVMLLAAPP